MEELGHNFADCTGRWLHHKKEKVVRCEVCGVQQEATIAVRLAAVYENSLGMLLSALGRS